ncbi:MAG: FixH family protein [Rhodocyclaceae bacterium]|nr:FixH family protein [Rhodocyclaceae bacterium]
MIENRIETTYRAAGKMPARPWYREPWPWLLMAGPLVVVIAGFVTLYLAVHTSDGLVTENYYQEGLRAGETVARSERAAALGLTARMHISGERARVVLSARAEGFTPPQALRLTLSHPTRAGLDRESLLLRTGETYQGRFELPASGHWLILIEDEARQWRLLASVLLPAKEEIIIGEN